MTIAHLKPNSPVDRLTQIEVDAIERHFSKDLELGCQLSVEWHCKEQGDFVNVCSDGVDVGVAFGKRNGKYHAISKTGRVLAVSSNLDDILVRLPH